MYKAIAENCIQGTSTAHVAGNITDRWAAGTVVRMERRAFEPAEFDPLYDFPKEMNESAQIYMALGRHDLKLEYRHRVLTIEPEA